MAYVSQWQSLSEVLAGVKANGCSEEEGRSDICRAMADRAVNLRAGLKKHTTKNFTSRNTVHYGEDFEIPRDLKPEDLDWEQSRPLKPWVLRREKSRLPGYWELEWIELYSPDVTKVFGLATKSAASVQPASPETDAKRRITPALDGAGRAVRELFPNGVPEQAVLPNAKLCTRVRNRLKDEGLPTVSDDTILRAAGRRK